MFMANDSNDRETVLARLRRARERMAEFIRANTGANIDEVTLIRGVLVVGGAPDEVIVFAAYMHDVLGVNGITIDDTDPDDPDYTFARVPEGACEAALEALTKGKA